MSAQPISPPSPIWVEVKPDLLRGTPLVKRSPPPDQPNDRHTAPTGPTKSTPSRQAKSRRPIYTVPEGSSDESEEETEGEEDEEQEFVVDDEEEEAEEEEEGEEDDQSNADTDYVDDDRVSALPSPPPSTSSTPAKKRRPAKQAGKAPKIPRRNDKPSSGPIKSGTFSGADDLALLSIRRPLQLGMEWDTAADSLGRTKDACRQRWKALNRKIEEAVLSGKL